MLRILFYVHKEFVSIKLLKIFPTWYIVMVPVLFLILRIFCISWSISLWFYQQLHTHTHTHTYIAFPHCSWRSQGKNTEVVYHSFYYFLNFPSVSYFTVFCSHLNSFFPSTCFVLNILFFLYFLKMNAWATDFRLLFFSNVSI